MGRHDAHTQSKTDKKFQETDASPILRYRMSSVQRPFRASKNAMKSRTDNKNRRLGIWSVHITIAISARGSFGVLFKTAVHALSYVTEVLRCIQDAILLDRFDFNHEKSKISSIQKAFSLPVALVLRDPIVVGN